MKMLFASILFCLLLLPFDLLAQEAVIVRNASERNGTVYLNLNKAADFNNQICKDKRIQKVTYFLNRKRSQDVFIFDTSGRVIKQILKNGKIVIDSIFLVNKTIVSKKHLNMKTVDSSHSIFIEKVISTDKRGNEASYLSTIRQSFIKGDIINLRNKSYNNHFESGDCIWGYPRHESNRYGDSYYMFPGVQVVAPMDGYFFQMPQDNIPRVGYPRLKTNYKSETLYLTLQTTVIKNFNGLSERRKRKLLLNSGTKYYVEGEVDNHYCRLGNVYRRKGYNEREIELEQFSKIKFHKNNRNLIDTAYLEYYPPQNIKLPCVQPKNRDCDYYLSGRSGVPQRRELYSLSYEYFDK